MYTGLLHLHSVLRWAVLAVLLIVIVKSFIGWFGNKDYSKGDRKLSVVAVSATHLQILIGLILYFVSPVVMRAMEDFGAAMKNAELRYWAMEHILVMLIAAVLITIGSAKAKRAADSVGKFKTQAIWFTITLILILSRIPWDRV